MDTNYNANSDWMRYVGYSDAGNPCEQWIFSDESIGQMQAEITRLLAGVDAQGRDIIVPRETIQSVLSSINYYYQPSVGNPASRYILGRNVVDDFQYIREQALQVIVSQVRDTLGIEAQNQALTVWTRVLGEHNAHRLRSHDIIKTRKRRPTPMQFNMNY